MVIQNSIPEAICPLCQEKKYSFKGLTTFDTADGKSNSLIKVPVVLFACDNCGHVVMKTPVPEVK